MSFLFGGNKSETTIPDWVAQPAQQNIAMAQKVAGMGYTPYYGPDVAAFTPMQNAAFQGTNDAAAAFGMPTAQGTGMPAPKTFAGGVQGYSSAPMYEQAIKRLERRNPEQYAALMKILQAFRQQGRTQAPTAAESILQQLTGAQSESWADKQLGGAPASYSGSPYTSLNTPLSYAPGGVNTNNPGGLLNTAVAGMSGPQGTPTAADRPMARP